MNYLKQIAGVVLCAAMLTACTDDLFGWRSDVMSADARVSGGDFDGAQKAIDAAVSKLSPSDADQARDQLMDFAHNYALEHKHEQALLLLKGALAAERKAGPDMEATVENNALYEKLIAVSARAAHYDDAEHYLAESMKLKDIPGLPDGEEAVDKLAPYKALPDKSRQILRTGELMQELGQTDRAARLYADGLDVIGKAFTAAPQLMGRKDYWIKAHLQAQLGKLQMESGQSEQGAQLLKEAQDTLSAGDALPANALDDADKDRAATLKLLQQN